MNKSLTQRHGHIIGCDPEKTPGLTVRESVRQVTGAASGVMDISPISRASLCV